MATLVKTELLTDINGLWKQLSNKNITTEEFDELYDRDISDLLWLRDNLKDRLDFMHHLDVMLKTMESMLPKDESCK
jgi:hypothetical protein